ncbi:MAG: hypothetical protein ACI8W7_000350 [Gammaproteobacteria bacterium]|jgi:hypothetical protein
MSMDIIAASEAYERLVKEHYANVVEPDLRANTKMDERLFGIGLLASLGVFGWIVWHVPATSALNILKIGAGVCIWSFMFACIHVCYHVHMWTHRRTLKQKAFAFYHHYVDIFMYSRHRAGYKAAQLLGFAFIVLPAMYIDNVIGATLFVMGMTDMTTHLWYHTRKRDRKQGFGPFAYWAIIVLERVGIINTRAHLVTHHTHDMHHLNEVKGWMDVRWPLIGAVCDALGDPLFRFFKDRPYGFYVLAIFAFTPLVLAGYVFDAHAVRDANALVLMLHVFVLMILLALGPARFKIRELLNSV